MIFFNSMIFIEYYRIGVLAKIQVFRDVSLSRVAVTLAYAIPLICFDHVTYR